MTTKPMSPAEYRANTAKNARPTEVVTLQSGAVFELRRPDLMGYVMTGRLPQSLLNLGFAAWNKQNVEKPEQVNTEDAAEMLIFMRTIVEEVTVYPKFVHVAINEDEIGAQDMRPEDFAEIFQWAMSGQGVTGPDGLKQFRKGRKRRTTADSVDSTEQRMPAEFSVYNLEERYGEILALDFDLTCTARLHLYDAEKEKRMAEAMGFGAITQQVAPSKKQQQFDGVFIDRTHAQEW